jgi:hypothetical protein
MAGFLYNRTKKCFKVTKKIEAIPTEDYDIDECCEPTLVLAHLTDTETWKNDLSSAWQKLDFATDLLEFKLYTHNDVLTSYQPDKIQFSVNELDFYCTVDWQQVLIIDGQGCFKLKIESTIDGVVNNFTWDEYELKPYSAENAKGTIRLKANFNQYHAIEDIDFTDSNVIDTIRLNGFFGSRKPDLVIDNLVYNGKVDKNVQREIINKYYLATDPIKEKITKKIVDLYLLSEFELFLSDHNEFNHTYSYKDLPLIVQGSPDIEYLEYSRFAKIKVELTDKIKNKISKYNG